MPITIFVTEEKTNNDKIKIAHLLHPSEICTSKFSSYCTENTVSQLQRLICS